MASSICISFEFGSGVAGDGLLGEGLLVEAPLESPPELQAPSPSKKPIRIKKQHIS